MGNLRRVLLIGAVGLWAGTAFPAPIFHDNFERSDPCAWSFVSGFTDLRTFYLDFDSDEYGDPASPTQAPGCVPPAGYVLNWDDCDDSDPLVNPGEPDLSCSDGDRNCDGLECLIEDICDNGADDDGDGLVDCDDPDCAAFPGCIGVAGMVINEINPNIGVSRDLIELLVTSAGSTNGVAIVQDGSALETLATMPDVTVAAGDFIVVHLNPAGAPGAAPGSETLSKTQYPSAVFSANYDNAWDFHGGTAGLTFSHRVLRVEAPGGSLVLDAVPFVLSNNPTPPAAFPGDLQTLQAAGRWLPANCGGSPCTYTSIPTAVQISVDYLGCGTTPTGNSVARRPGQTTMQNADWYAAAAQTMGLVNP